MVEALIQIGWQRGFDRYGFARLAARAAQFESEIVCTTNGRAADGKDVTALISLRAKPGARVHVRVSGADEAAALEALAEVFAFRNQAVVDQRSLWPSGYDGGAR